MSKTVTIGGSKCSLSKWCRDRVTEEISGATRSMVAELENELADILAKKYGVSKPSHTQTVWIAGFKQSAEKELWLNVRTGSWQRLMDWAVYFAKFSGELNGTYYDDVKVEKLL